MDRIILDLCGGTGSWSKPYAVAGYDVRLVTLPDNDVLTYAPPDGVYGILAAPPCTQFSFARTKAKIPRNLREGMTTIRACLEIIWHCQCQLNSDQQKYSPLNFWALENPYLGMLRWFLGRPPFVFDPYEFGDDYQKRTALWGSFSDPIKCPVEMSANSKNLCKTNSRDLPKFDHIPSRDIHPEHFGKLDRAARRAITPAGFARAFFKANP